MFFACILAAVIVLSQVNELVQISASVLAFDLSDIKNNITKLEVANIDMLHFDVMDGVFVPEITFGHHLIGALRQHTKLLFDTHLMVGNPSSLIEKFAEVGSNIITIHAESTVHLDREIRRIKDLGCKAGIALNPSTDHSAIRYLLEEIDLILVMTVNPGFCGQSFLRSQLEKIRSIRNMIDAANPNIILSVDGGITNETAHLAINAGASMLVSGSYLQKNIRVIEDAIAFLRAGK